MLQGRQTASSNSNNWFYRLRYTIEETSYGWVKCHYPVALSSLRPCNAQEERDETTRIVQTLRRSSVPALISYVTEGTHHEF